MKFIQYTILAILVSFSTLSAKDLSVPTAVKSAFSKKFPKATQVKWTKEGANFESSFSMIRKHMSATYNAAGEIQEIETQILVVELPQKAKEYAKKKGTIKEAARIVTSEGKVKYEAEVNGKDLVFDEKGNFIEQQ